MILSYRLARASLKSHRMRTILTTLGVAIGVFIISLILIISSGLHRGINNQISALSDNIIIVQNSNNNSDDLETFSPLKAAPISTLTDKDVNDLKRIDNINEVSPMTFMNGKISGNEKKSSKTTIVATNSDFPKVFNLKLKSGNWFNNNETKKYWTILGNKLSRDLLGTENPAGQIVTIKGKDFTVIGVIEKVNQPISLAGVDIDKTAFISTENSLVFNNIRQIGQVALRAKSDKKLNETSDKISSNLAKNHADDSEISVYTGQNAIGNLSNWLDTITKAALIFAGISLIVGGIGIMNIMLVSVTERIREIGIRKSVGATQRNIMVQFLFEALLMTIYGGVIGLTLAYCVAYLITLQFSLPLAFDWWIFTISLGVPLSVGLLFGFWPAARAAKQDPIEALKS